MTEIIIKNATANVPQNTYELEVQVAPFGKFDGVMHSEGKDKPIVQNLDQEAFERIINAAGGKEILVDADHTSADGGSTRAYAWAKDLRIDNERGLLATFCFTPFGQKTIEEREYRFVSPTFGCSKNGDILSLTSIALTNKPNLPVSCVLNSSESGVTTVEEGKDPEMEELKTLLGLGPDATPEDVASAVKALQQKVADADAAALKNEAEACADANKDKIENRKAFVDLYVKNGKDVATAFLAAVKTPAKAPEEPAQTILNANAGTTPTVGVSPLREGLAKCKNAEERVSYITAHAAEFAAEAK
jgi:phage I-like protein